MNLKKKYTFKLFFSFPNASSQSFHYEKIKEKYQTKIKSMNDPIELLKCLMKAHQLKSVDLVNILGIQRNVVSQILSYKKGLSKDVICKLSDHFKLSQEAFNRSYELIPTSVKKPVKKINKETVYLLSNPNNAKFLNESIQEIEHGKTISYTIDELKTKQLKNAK